MENASTMFFGSRRHTFLRTVDSTSLAQQLLHEKLVWMLRRVSHFEEKAEESYTFGLLHGTRQFSAF